MDSPSPRARELEWQGCSGDLLELCIDVIINRCDYDYDYDVHSLGLLSHVLVG